MPCTSYLDYLVETHDAQGQTIISQLDLGTATNYVALDLPSNTFVCVTVTPYNDAGSASACTATCFMTAMTTSVEEVGGGDLVLYPTATQDYIIVATEGVSRGSASSKLTFLMADGTVVRHKADYVIGSRCDVQALPPGLYYVRVAIAD